MKLIDWVHYQVLHDEFENHENRDRRRTSMHNVWIHLLRVLAMMHICAICGEPGQQLWTKTRCGENIPELWICIACRKDWLK